MAELNEEAMAYEPDEDREEDPDPGGGILPLIDLEYFYDLLMEQQEQM
jgi:hypothetical protein